MVITRIIGLTGTQLIRRGSHYVALCPLHGEKTPSLVVYPQTDSWCCFGGCQPKTGKRYNGGDATEFISQFYNWSRRDAKSWIKAQLGTLPKLPEIVVKKPEPKPVVDEAVLYWHSLLDVCGRREYYHSRLIDDDMINREYWGWDGSRYTIPIWDGEPGYSQLLGVRRRASDENSLKYVGIKGLNDPTVWGKHYCKDERKLFCFAGEFDAALANQDGYPSFSLVNGINAFRTFPDNWPELWFPDAKQLIVVFDKKEEPVAGQLASQWNKHKGTMQGKVYHWPPLYDFSDYTEFRQQNIKFKLV